MLSRESILKDRQDKVNLQFIGGRNLALQMKLTISTLKERVSRLKIKRKDRRILFNAANKLASFTLLVAVLPLSIVNSSQFIKSANRTDSGFDSTVAFNTSLPQALSVGYENEIVPGESLAQKELREKAEREAMARVEAEARLREERKVISRDGRYYDDPLSFDDIYRRAGQTFGVDARLLRAIHYVETGQSGSTTKTSYAGATGPMQFIPSTWRNVGIDANEDGVADIHNVEDAIFGAARYLRLCGYPDVRRALWSYNPSRSYYLKVTRIANGFGMEINQDN